MPLPRIRLQQLQHHRVIGIPIPGQRPPHDPGQMQIPHRHRIRRPMTALHRLRRRPRTDPRHDLQPRPSRRRLHPGRLLQPRGQPNRTQDRRRPLVVDPGPMPLPGRNQRPRPRRGHHIHRPGRGPRRRLPELPHQQPPRPIRLIGRDLLLQNRRNQTTPAPARSASAAAPAADAGLDATSRCRGTNADGSSAAPSSSGNRSSSHSAPGPQASPAHLVAARGDPQRPGPGRRAAGPPHRPVRRRPERRIARPAPQRPEHQTEIQRPVRHPVAHPSRPGRLPRHASAHGDMPAAHGRTRGPGSEASCHE